MKNSIIHLTNPATDWENASFLGNGACGMMIHGGVATDKITLNEESIWSSAPIDKDYTGMPEKIAELRGLFLENRVCEANEQIAKSMGTYPRIKSYEYAGELLVSVHGDEVFTKISYKSQECVLDKSILARYNEIVKNLSQK